MILTDGMATKKKITSGLRKVLSAIMIGFIPHGDVERWSHREETGT